MPQQVNIGGTIVTVYTIDDFPADAAMADANKFAYIKAGVMKSLTLANLKAILAALHYTKAEVDALLETTDEATANFAPYDALFTYLAGTTYYVSHASRIYKFISPNNSLGVAPGEDPAVWEITSQNEFTHESGYTGEIERVDASFNVAAIRMYIFKGAAANATFPAMNALKNRSIVLKNAGKMNVDGVLTFLPNGAETFLVNGVEQPDFKLFPGAKVEVAVDKDLTNLTII